MHACLPNDLDQLRDPWRCANRHHAPRTASSSQHWTMCLVSHQSLLSVEYTSLHTSDYLVTAIMMQIASSCGTIACAICMPITVEHCKSASANSDSFQSFGSIAATCLDFVSSRQHQRHSGKPEHNDEIPLLQLQPWSSMLRASTRSSHRQ